MSEEAWQNKVWLNQKHDQKHNEASFSLCLESLESDSCQKEYYFVGSMGSQSWSNLEVVALIDAFD